MALDTRNKRASAIGIGRYARVVLPAPDGSVAVPDRKHGSMSYAGIAAGTLTGAGRQVTGLLANRSTFTLQAS